eukprot:gene7173-9782_t
MVDNNKRNLYFASQGLRSQEIEVAPDLPSDTLSKRYGLIVNEDKELNYNLEQLDIGTKARNRAFQDRLDEVWKSTSGYEAKLRIESKEAAETILHMRDEYQKHIDDFSLSLEQEINSIFNKVDNEIIPQESARVDVIEKDLELFIKDTVPAEIELHTGLISRQLKRAYETFDIEKMKERKRETKIVKSANKHLQNTCQRFEDERALLSSCFFNIEDEIIEHERHSARMQLLRNDKAINNIIVMNKISTVESKTRQVEDVDVLDTLLETQNLLQQTILMHFGTQSEGDDFPPLVKLRNRMDKIEQKHVDAAALAKAHDEEHQAAKEKKEHEDANISSTIATDSSSHTPTKKEKISPKGKK